MTHADKHIIDTYTHLFEGLSSMGKRALVARLTKLLKSEKNNTEEAFYNSYGSFASDKTAEEIVADIKTSRSFRERNVEL